MIVTKNRAVFLLLSVFSVLAGCTAAGDLAPSLPAEEHAQRAENLVFQRKTDEAAREYRQAVLAAPSDTGNYLRLAELHEIGGELSRAESVLNSALEQSAPTAEQRIIILHRRALLQALKLGTPEKASRSLAQMPSDSLAYKDTQGAIALGQGHWHEALTHFAAARERARGNDDQGLVMYHAALAYYRLSQESNAAKALYHAINLAENAALIHDIKQLWKNLDAPAR